MESVLSHDDFAVETEHSSALTKDEEFGIISEDGKLMEAPVIGSESCFVRQYDIRCT